MSKPASECLSNASLLPAWFESEQGRALISEECAALKTLVPDQFYRVALQVGLREKSVLRDISVEQPVYCDSGGLNIADVKDREERNRVIALPEALPFAEGSVDLSVLFHTLDYCDDPHRVLREMSQLLTHQGVLVVSGFHAYSLWGARRRLSRKTSPFDGRYISRAVLQDWLELLGFQTVTACMINYQLPQLKPRWRERLSWMNSAGDRWWPTLGAVYVLVVKKQLYAGVHMGRSARPQRKWFAGVNPASAKISNQRREAVDTE